MLFCIIYWFSNFVSIPCCDEGILLLSMQKWLLSSGYFLFVLSGDAPHDSHANSSACEPTNLYSEIKNKTEVLEKNVKKYLVSGLAWRLRMPFGLGLGSLSWFAVVNILKFNQLYLVWVLQLIVPELIIGNEVMVRLIVLVGMFFRQIKRLWVFLFYPVIPTLYIILV